MNNLYRTKVYAQLDTLSNNKQLMEEKEGEEKTNDTSDPKDANTSEVPHTKGDDKPHDEHPPGETKEQASQDKPQGKQKKAREKWERSDVINAVGVLVNTLLLLCTLGALFFSWQAVNVTRDSFEVQNRPYLQIENLSLRYDSAKKLNYSISNLGQYPAKIVSSSFHLTGIIRGGAFELGKPNNDKYVPIDNKMEPFPFINKYVINGSPIVRDYSLDSISSNIPIYAFSYLLFEGQITYTNEVNGKDRVYYFRINISGYPSTKFEMFRNDNFDFPDK